MNNELDPFEINNEEYNNNCKKPKIKRKRTNRKLNKEINLENKKLLKLNCNSNLEKINKLDNNSTINIDIKDNPVKEITLSYPVSLYKYGNEFNLLSVKLSDSITSLPNNLFKNSQLKELKLPKNLKSIGDNCFRDCRLLISELKLPDSLTYIGYGAFRSCEGSILNLSNNLKFLPDRLFDNACFKKIQLGENTLVIGSYCFAGLNNVYRCEIVLNKNLVRINDFAFFRSRILIKEFPESLKSIGKSCFKEAFINNVFDLIITYISNLKISSFMGCSLKSITLPYGLKDLGDCCFAYCINLVEVNFPDSLETIGNFCFYKCFSLEKVIFPKGLIKIGDYCFFDCISLYIVGISMNDSYGLKRFRKLDFEKVSYDYEIDNDKWRDKVITYYDENDCEYKLDSSLSFDDEDFESMKEDFQIQIQGDDYNFEYGDYCFNYTSLLKDYDLVDLYQITMLDNYLNYQNDYMFSPISSDFNYDENMEMTEEEKRLIDFKDKIIDDVSKGTYNDVGVFFSCDIDEEDRYDIEGYSNKEQTEIESMTDGIDPNDENYDEFLDYSTYHDSTDLEVINDTADYKYIIRNIERSFINSDKDYFMDAIKDEYKKDLQ